MDEKLFKFHDVADGILSWIVNTVDKSLKTRFEQLKDKCKPPSINFTKVLFVKPLPRSDKEENYPYYRDVRRLINAALEKALGGNLT